jgi:serine/threonine protein kinase
VSDVGDEVGGRYRLERLLRRGPMSEVWAARDLELERAVAVKLLAPTAAVERFRREARAVASLAHENVTRLYDYGEDHDRPYMVLEYLPGGTLADRLRDEGRLDPRAAEALAAGIAAGLAHAHDHGVVHRDLKPANVLFDPEGRPKIADFGIARMAAGEATITEAGTVLGTAAYLSPEQAAGESAGPASDVYALGVILYRMLVGRLPFEADDPMELALLHRDAPPPGPESLPSDVPPALAAVTLAALAKDPAARPHDGAALLAALTGSPDPASAPTLIVPPTDETRVLARTPARRSGGRGTGWRFLVAGLLLALVAAGAGLAWVVTRQPSATTPPPNTTSLTGETLPQEVPSQRVSTQAPTTESPTTRATTAESRPASTTSAATTAPTTTTTPETTTTAPTEPTEPTTTEATTTAPTEPTTTTATTIETQATTTAPTASVPSTPTAGG